MQIYLAGGCFWGVEKYLANQDGVTATEVGYANGTDINPTYEDVCTGLTGHAETVKVDYTGELATLLAAFYKVINPTILNRQGPDVGTQYRTGIFYTTENEREIAQKSLSELAKEYDEPIVVELLPLTSYYRAEEYHQKYLDKNPGGYCHIPQHILNRKG